MPSITLRDMPVDLHAQLKREADANFRSLDEEAMVRIEQSFKLEEGTSADAVNQLIQEALASGPEQPLTRADFDAARQRAREQFALKNSLA
jgi:plasmid stability protein